jgi:hypothetical protein
MDRSPSSPPWERLPGGITAASFAEGALPAAPTPAQIWQATEIIEGQYTPQQAIEFIAAVLAGKVTTGSNILAFKGIGTDTPRVTVTADQSGTRASVVFATP